MARTALSPEEQAEIKELSRAIEEAIAEEINELATNLATTDDAHLFGENEFKIRAIAHRIAAKALEQRLAKKKRIRRGQRDLPDVWPSRRVPCAPCTYSHEPRRPSPTPASLLLLSAVRSWCVPLRSRRRPGVPEPHTRVGANRYLSRRGGR